MQRRGRRYPAAAALHQQRIQVLARQRCAPQPRIGPDQRPVSVHLSLPVLQLRQRRPQRRDDGTGAFKTLHALHVAWRQSALSRGHGCAEELQEGKQQVQLCGSASP